MRCLSPYRALAAVLVPVLALPAICLAQYFGQNKVRYHTYDFKVLKTEHFDVYYYDQERRPAEELGRMAERWYARFARILDHQLSSRQPVIVYSNQIDFQSTTVIPEMLGETTGGVTEPLKRRIVMPLAGPLKETNHIIGHELVHAFQYDIQPPQSVLSAGSAGLAGLPLWFIEGMAEYLSLGPMDSNTAMWMRDAVARDQLPDISKLDNPKFFPYRYGQAVWAFIGGRYGDESIGSILKAAVRTGSAAAAIQRVLGVSMGELSNEWKSFLTGRDRPIIAATVDLADEGRIVISQPERGGEINVSPAISPDGKWIMFFSQKGLFSIDLFLADARSGEIKKKITDTAISPHYNNLEFVNSSGAWSRDGRQFAFGHVRAGRAQISIYDMQKDGIVRVIPIPEVSEIYTPTWSPRGDAIAFSALTGGLTDLFAVDLSSGRVRRLTDDAYADLQPAWSPDGNSVAFVTDRFTSDLAGLSFGQYCLALLDLSSGQTRALHPEDRGKQIDPQWSPDGASLYFVSDRGGIPNIYRMDRAGNDIQQITNIRTGVTGITNLSPAISLAAASSALAYSAFSDRGYDILLMESPQSMTRPAADAETQVAADLSPQRPNSGQLVSLLEDKQAGLVPAASFQAEPYSPHFSLDYVAPPNLAVGTSNFGTLIGGGTALYFSDILGYHNLVVGTQVSTNLGSGTHFFRNLNLIAQYVNQRHRWAWGIAGGQVPYVSAGFASGLASGAGGTFLVNQSITFWQINRQITGLLQYPFSRAQRMEFNTGYENISFAAESNTGLFSPFTGGLVSRQTQELPTAASLNLASGSAALVYDTSLFGGASPIAGQSYRLEAGYSAGSISFSTALVDYRRYLRVTRSLSLAGRLLHYGRYGGAADDPRLQELFLGYPSLVRGYDFGSFSAAECGPSLNVSGACPVFDRLIGSRLGVANAELRLQLIGPLGILPARNVPPVELAPFYDAGIAWTSIHKADFLGGDRKPVTSEGVSLRFNLLGFAVGQVSYAHPNDRPQKSAVWSFSFLPGF